MRPLAVFAALPVLALAACGEPAKPPPPVAAAPAGPRAIVQVSAIPDLKPVAAVVTTRRMGEARARIGGTLVQLTIKEGDFVREGQVIGRVADQRIGFETRAYAAQAAAAEAQAVQAEAALKRVQALYEKGYYAKAALEEADAAAKAARQTAGALGAQRAASAELAAQGAILAPATGRVLKADVPAGSVVTPGQTIATITAGEPLVRLEIPEGQARALKVGDAVRLDPRDLPGAATAGTIVQVYPAVTAGRVTADIAVPGLAADLVGQRVRVLVTLGERPALTVPRRYVATRFGVDYVSVLDARGRPSDIAVQLAPGPDATRAEVLSGLADGDVIVPPRAG
jgi:RND family efflux transporter MFP subunit